MVAAVNKPPSNGSVTVTDVSGVFPALVTVKVYVTVSTDAVEHPLVSISLNTPDFVIAIASKQDVWNDRYRWNIITNSSSR